MAAQPMMSMAAAQAGLNAITALLNVGGTGTIIIKTGAAPATVETAATGTTLSSGLTFSATAFANATDPGSTGLATATANAIANDASAANTGTAGYFRALNHAGTAVLQGTCGTSSADMILNTTAITAADTIVCTSFVITLADGSGAD